MTIRGLDISAYQGNFNAAAAKAAGYSFVYAKATEGANFTDPTFQGHRAACRAAGLAFGAYWFSRPSAGGSPIPEVDYYLRTVGAFAVGEFAVMDIEAGAGNLASWVDGSVTYFNSQRSFWPIMYSGRWFMDPHGVDAASVTAQNCGLILSGYTPTPPSAPPGWTMVGWQYTDKQQVYPGLVCDADVFYGDVATLHKYGFGGSNPVPITPPPPAPPPPKAHSDWVIRDVAFAADGLGGYELDFFGGLHPLGNMPAAKGAGYWNGWDIARCIVLAPDGSGGYQLDGWGGIHAFAARGAAPIGIDASKQNAYWKGFDIARRLVITDWTTGKGYSVDGWGGLHPLNGATAYDTTGTYFPGGVYG